MPVKMKNTSEIKVRLGIQKKGPVEKFLVHTCKIHMDKYVPYDEGTLADTAVEEPGQVRYIQPYAHYIYEGLVMGPSIPIIEDNIVVRWFSPKGKAKHYTGKHIDYSKSKAKKPLATSYWDKHMVTAEMPDIIKETQDFINRGGK